MKKFGLAVVGIIAAIIALANLGSLLALALSGLIVYAGYYYFKRTNSTFFKFFWGVVIFFALLSIISNVPAFIGLVAIALVIYSWMKWKGHKSTQQVIHSKDPFDNFEREWKNLHKN